MSRIIDVTWPIYEGMTTPMVPWHPYVEISILGRHHQEGRASRKLVLGTHIGTHMDAPYHFIPDGMTIDKLPLERLVSSAVVLDLTDKKEYSKIEVADFEKYADKIKAGDSIIMNTNWWTHWDTPDFYKSWPCLTAESCQWLIDKGVLVAAMDTPGPDDPTEGLEPGDVSPRHYQLLSNGVILVEYLANLDQITEERVTLIALPLKIRGGDGSPARVLVVED